MNILTADDSASMRMLLGQSLREAGHQVVETKDGLEALTRAEESAFSLVITDVNMPNLDGIGLVQRLRALPAYKHTPILLLTTEIDPAKKAFAKSVGATGWMVKPFDPEKVLATIRKVCG